MVSFGAKLVPLAAILLLASTVEPNSSEVNMTIAEASAAGVPASAGIGAGWVAAGGGVTGAGVADSSCLPQALSASRSEEHTSELQSLMRISYAVFCLKKKK